MRNMKRGPAAAFAEDKGFYIILFLCIAAIAVSGYVLFFTPAPAASEPLDTAVYEPTVTPDDMTPVLGAEDDVPVAAVEEPAAPASAETQPAPASGTAAESGDTAVETVTQPSAPAFVRPVSGDVIEPFSGDELVFQETFGDWRTHTGADYTAELGTRVYAITDGTVEDVFTDGLYGTCVTLSHADSLQTVYKGLAENVKVKTGQTVKAGDVLGTVDDTNLAETAQGPHLHVEAVQNGVRIDPETLLTGE